MRILHTGDWHLGRTLEGRSRIEEQAAFLDELSNLVRDEDIDLVLIAGDIYDSVNPPAAAESMFYESLAELAEGGKRHVVVISGNHDHPDRLAASGPLAQKQGVTLIGMPTPNLQTYNIQRTGEQAKVFGLPYPSEARLRELFTEAGEEEKLRSAYSDRVARLIAKGAEGFQNDTVNLVMSHLYVLGGAESESERPIQVGGAYTVDVNAFAVNAQYAALGHLHRAQNMKASIPVRYSGSPLAYSFSEAGQAKSVTILDLKPGQAAHPREVFLQSGKPLVKWRAKEGLPELWSWLEERRDASAWIDVEVHLKEAMSLEQIQRLRKAHDGFIHIRPIYPEMKQEESRVSIAELSMEELFRRFYVRQTGGAEPDHELVQLFLELLNEENDGGNKDQAREEVGV
ncbi:exonuclease SbcCD subunit D [Paenibacillus sp. KN14-4R]|uniref:exonuclease SbcCD subunit D n=1 Tax=Paenibacillus sp. KN14-4R TaxID=3445773 RepID=UPI003F9EDE78